MIIIPLKEGDFSFCSSFKFTVFLLPLLTSPIPQGCTSADANKSKTMIPKALNPAER